LAELLDQIRIIIEEVIRGLGYPGIAIVMLLENLVPPIPSELVMPFAGFLVADRSMTFVGVVIAGTIGSGLGALFIYYLGRELRYDRVRDLVERYGKFLLISLEDFEKVNREFARHGKWYVLAGRLIPGVRSLISIPAGMNEMPLGNFMIYTLAGTVGWNSLLAGAGVILGSEWETILGVIAAYENILGAIFIMILLVFIARRLQLLIQNKGERV
jgi:membrane protein DedA with SNARE-associated domain